MVYQGCVIRPACQRFIKCEQKYGPLPGGREVCAVFPSGDPSQGTESPRQELSQQWLTASLGAVATSQIRAGSSIRMLLPNA